MKPDLDHRALRALLDYDLDTGIFTWRERPDNVRFNTRFAGQRAGWVHRHDGNARLYIRIFGYAFEAHRLAHLYMTGSWPALEIDHIDCDGLNNQWRNLREATRSQNERNKRAHRDNKLGIKGVSKFRGKYRAVIHVDGKQRYLGSFDTEENAHAAFSAAMSLHFPQFGRAE